MTRTLTFFSVLVLPCCLAATQPFEKRMPLDGEEQAADDLEHPEDVEVFVMSPEAFEPWAFGGNRAFTGDLRQGLYRAMESQAERFGRTYELSEQQVTKLRLAGQGDVDRYWAELEQVREKFLQPRYGTDSIDDMDDDRARLLASHELLFSPYSLQRKTLFAMLPEADRKRYEQEQFEWARHHHAYAIGALMRFVVPGGRSPEQRSQLEQQLMERIPVPRASTAYDLYLAVLHLAQLPPDELIALDPAFQGKNFHALLEQARNIEPLLIRHGLIDSRAAK